MPVIFVFKTKIVILSWGKNEISETKSKKERGYKIKPTVIIISDNHGQWLPMP